MARRSERRAARRRASPRAGRVPVGLSAESRAAAYLVAKGYRIVARRFRSPVGEIDIVARRRGVLVFVEVKARSTLDDAAEVAVCRASSSGSPAAAGAWLAAHPEDADSDIRFDAVLVAPGRIPRHIPAAFETRLACRSRRAGFCENASIWSRMRCATAPSSSATARTRRRRWRGCCRWRRRRGSTSSAVSQRALGGNIDAARDLLRGRALLGHRRRDRAADRADVADGALDRRDRLDRTAGRVLHVGDLLGDILGRLARSGRPAP